MEFQFLLLDERRAEWMCVSVLARKGLFRDCVSVCGVRIRLR